MPRQAIRMEGQGAEDRFLVLVREARPSDSQKRGDAIVLVDGTPFYVEIKYATSNTVNQVRAIKFIPLVIYSPQLADAPWAVVAPHEVVRLVSEKARGQHSEIAFECANMSLNGVPSRFRCTDEQLGDTVIEAIRESRKYAELEADMKQLHSELRDVCSRYQIEARESLRKGDAR